MSDRPKLAAVEGLARLPGPPPRTVKPKPSTPKQATATAPAGVEEPAAPAAAPAAASPAETSGRRKPPAQRPGKAALTTRATAISLPPELIDQVRERARRDGVSQPDLLLDALSATQERLGSVFSEEARTPVSDGLFIRRPRPGETKAVGTLSLRLIEENIATIDRLAEQLGAPSRSALIAAALRLYLEG